MNKENKIIFYQDKETNIKIDVIFNDETFWMTQKMIADLFGVKIPAISKHLKNIYEDKELLKDSTISKMETVQNESTRLVKRNVEIFNLDVIIAVGYRVNSKQATKFRIWATNTLKEYITKGFIINDDMLKNGRKFGKDYFEELLERIREIRASERRIYQKIMDIFETCSADYDKTAEETLSFFKIIQNKLHFAVTNETAAEIIYNRANNKLPNMGLTTWKGSPNKKIVQSDVFIAKNYLNKAEIDKLNRLVTMFIDYAEFNALEQNIITMNDWLKVTDEFLSFNKRKLLVNSGNISHELAIKKVKKEYDIFRKKQDKEYISGMDELYQKYLQGTTKKQ